MKRTIFKSLLAIACLLGSTSVLAYDFEVDGIYYDVVSLSELTCKVVKEASNKYYEGEIIIPATVNYANKTLTVVEIGYEVFRGSSDLTGITIPNTISSIGNNMFNDCSKLARVTIEDGNTVLELGYKTSTDRGLFYNCPIDSLYLGRNLSYNPYSSSGYSPFALNSSIKKVTIGNSVTSIGQNAFYWCSRLISVDIPNSVTSIGSFAFYNCSGLTSVTIPNSVTEISSSAFAYCSGLTSVTIPNSVTSIGDNAFYNCSSLTSVTIGNSVTSIGSYAFEYCSSLTTLYSFNTTPPNVGSNNFTNNQYMTLNVFVPQEALEVYQNANTWNNFWNLQGFDATGVENVKAEGKNANVYYDLRGNRLNAPKRGLNIINHKKVMMKP